MGVSVVLENCIRSLSVSAGCDKCKNICQDDAIDFDAGFVRIDGDKCTDCNLCVGICPTAAIEAKEINFAAFSPDEIFYTAVNAEQSFCIDVDNKAYSACSERALEANSLLAAFGKEYAVEVKVVQSEAKTLEDNSKRALFRLFSKEGIKAASEKLKSAEEMARDLDFKTLKNKKIPLKREIFLEAIESLDTAENMQIGISFASDKVIDETCSNCTLCYNLCPSGALETTMMKNAILFSPHLCLKCRLCEDVCESKSISSLPLFALDNFKHKTKKVLVKFKVKLCESCGAVFSGDDNECPRCAKESEDAHELLGF